jgi:hypothetical protein
MYHSLKRPYDGDVVVGTSFSVLVEDYRIIATS